MTPEWIVYDYELEMFRGTIRLGDLEARAFFSQHIQNAIVESLLLHTRILVEMIISCDTEDDAINLKTLLPGFDSPKIQELKDAYGKRDDPNSPRYTINKRLAHSTRIRSYMFNYGPIMNRLAPLIHALVEEIAADSQRRQ